MQNDTHSERGEGLPGRVLKEADLADMVSDLQDNMRITGEEYDGDMPIVDTDRWDLIATIRHLQQERAGLVQQVEKVTNRLAWFGEHKSGCQAIRQAYDRACDCGFRSELATLRAFIARTEWAAAPSPEQQQQLEHMTALTAFGRLVDEYNKAGKDLDLTDPRVVEALARIDAVRPPEEAAGGADQDCPCVECLCRNQAFAGGVCRDCAAGDHNR